jgi:hypothetical protein
LNFDTSDGRTEIAARRLEAGDRVDAARTVVARAIEGRTPPSLTLFRFFGDGIFSTARRPGNVF